MILQINPEIPTGISTGEIVAYSIAALFGAKELWSYLKNRNNNFFKLKKERLEADERNISELQQKYYLLESRYNNLELKYGQMQASFKIIYPLIKELAKDNASVKLAIEAMEDLFIEEKK